MLMLVKRLMLPAIILLVAVLLITSWNNNKPKNLSDEVYPVGICLLNYLLPWKPYATRKKIFLMIRKILCISLDLASATELLICSD